MWELGEEIKKISLPLASFSDLEPFVSYVGDSRFVLLGEATHGTDEFHRWRAEISKKLISEKGFSFIAVEGDWPDCYEINRYIKNYPNTPDTAIKALGVFSRWPAWMWANWETKEMVEWLRAFNEERPREKKVGFYGLDIYSLWDSLAQIIDFLKQKDPQILEDALVAFRCFEPFGQDVENYAVRSALVPESCEDEVVSLLVKIRERKINYKGDFEEYFNVEQNALAAKNAESYYRTMMYSGADSWNIRDTHMAETLERLTELYGPGSKAIVWAHNTHIGDAIYTDMAEIGEVSLGEIIRHRHQKEGVVLLGFSTYQGETIAARSWGQPMERMFVPPAIPGSWDAFFHQAVGKDSLYLFREKQKESKLLSQPQGLRAIGVVYNPDDELAGYVPTFLSKRFDGLIYLDHTSALQPLPVASEPDVDYPQTFPTAV